MNVRLLRVLRLVIRADSDPGRQALFANFKDAHILARLAFQVHERLRDTRASALLGACYGLGTLASIGPSRPPGARVLVVANQANAKRQVARAMTWIGPDSCAWIRSGARALTAAGLFELVRRPLAARLFPALRIVRAIDVRYGFLVSCRAASAMAWYARSATILRAHAPRAILVSSDTHPEEVAFAAAARALGIPQVFVSHAYPTPVSPALDFTLSILEGQAAVNHRLRKGPIRGRVALAGVEGESSPLDVTRLARPSPVIGIFPPKAVRWSTLVAAIDDCRRLFHARRIVIRWHPSMLEPSRLADLVDHAADVEESPPTAALPEVAGRCDWVVADENSNVHLPVLKLGIPTIALRNLGIFPEWRTDQYGFVADRIILPPVAALPEVRLDEAMAFFTAGWAERFVAYDASYLRDPRTLDAGVRAAIADLLTHRVGEEVVA